MQIECQPAFVLHSRAYGDTSLIIDCFSRTHGRVSLYARGARSKKKNSIRPLLNPFLPLMLSARGKASLKTITLLESSGPAIAVRGRALYCAFYINELLVRLLSEEEEQDELFGLYGEVLYQLANYQPDLGDAPLEAMLRTFEWRLINKIGMGFSLVVDALSGQAINAGGSYRFQHMLGMVAAGTGVESIAGQHLIDFDNMSFQSADARVAVKKLMRKVLAPLLGSRPLKSRELFL